MRRYQIYQGHLLCGLLVLFSLSVQSVQSALPKPSPPPWSPCTLSQSISHEYDLTHDDDDSNDDYHHHHHHHYFAILLWTSPNNLLLIPPGGAHIHIHPILRQPHHGVRNLLSRLEGQGMSVFLTPSALLHKGEQL